MLFLCLSSSFTVLVVLHLAFRLEEIRLNMSAALDRLTASVAAQRTVEASVVTLLSDLATKVRNLPADDSDAVNALADEIDEQTKSLSDAVVTNSAGLVSDPNSPTVPGTTAADPGVAAS